MLLQALLGAIRKIGSNFAEKSTAHLRKGLCESKLWMHPEFR